MSQLLNVIAIGWGYFAQNILTQPAYFIGLIVLVGYILLRKTWYEALAGFIKATVGYMILAVGSGGLVNNFRPILVGLNERFQLNAMVIDPYFGQNAVTAGLDPVFGRTFAQVMMLLLIAFIFNILLVRFKKITKMRSIFTTGHVQMQQASTAFWIMLFCFPILGNTQILLMMGLILGLYWAVGTNLLVKPTQELTDGAGFSIAHQQMFGIFITDWILEKTKGKSRKEIKKLEDVKLPGFLSIFNENMVSTAILMTLFFSVILLMLGRDYLVSKNFLGPKASFLFYVITTSFNFAVYLAILQLGVRTFVTELTQSFQGISHAWLPGAVPGVDCAVSYGFGAPNAVTIGFLFGALGQFISIGLLLAFKSPVVIIAGFVPMFFDNATIGVYANNKGGIRAAIIFPFLCGVCQVFGSAFIASFIGLAQYGGYLGMWDWAVLWPAFTVLMKYAGYIGYALIVIFLIVIPQLQCRKEKDLYFLVTEDYGAYKAKKGI
ncbi:MAG: PTS ascorbate transporter subunit IIC [Treponema sp.]|jgi:PTS system ascorbate-specific IIC component|nr:PTS ascorbate transporter subunit IIC [Treponema sp.]